MFLWRACHNIISAMTNLKKKGIEEIPLYPFCKRSEETVDHFLAGCKRSSQLWMRLFPNLEMGKSLNGCFRARWTEWMKILSETKITIAGITCWALWNDRNAVINNKLVLEVNTKADWILEYVNEFSGACKAGAKAEGERIPRKNEWVPPPTGLTKINRDRACANNRSGIGVLSRNDKLDIVAALVDVQAGSNSLSAKIRAIRDGLKLATRLGLKRVLVEFDSLEAIHLICEDEEWWGEVGNWLAEIRTLSSAFSSISFYHIFRELTNRAHYFAREASRLGQPCLWLSNFPCFVC